MRKATAILLMALLQLAFLAISCSDKAAQVKAPEGTMASSLESYAETTRKSAGVPSRDYGGKSFDIFVSGNWANDWTESYDFHAPEMNGELINDVGQKAHMDDGQFCQDGKASIERP